MQAEQIPLSYISNDASFNLPDKFFPTSAQIIKTAIYCPEIKKALLEVLPVMKGSLALGSIVGGFTLSILPALDSIFQLSRLIDRDDLLRIPITTGSASTILSLTHYLLTFWREPKKKEKAGYDPIRRIFTIGLFAFPLAYLVGRGATMAFLKYLREAGDGEFNTEKEYLIPALFSRQREQLGNSLISLEEAFRLFVPVFDRYFGKMVNRDERNKIFSWLLKTKPTNHLPGDKPYIVDEKWSSIKYFVRFAESYYRNNPAVQEKYSNFEKFYSEEFLPLYFESFRSMDMDIFSALGLIFWSNNVNPTSTTQNNDIRSDQKRLIYGYLRSRLLSKKAMLLPNLTLFLAYPIQGPYKNSPLGAHTGIRSSKEPSIGINDTEISIIAKGILEIVKNAGPISNKLSNDYRLQIEAIRDLESAWTDYENQRTMLRDEIEKYLGRINTPDQSIDDPIFSQMLKNPNDQAWQEIGMGIGIGGNSLYLNDWPDAVWQTTHTTRVWREYVFIEQNKDGSYDELQPYDPETIVPLSFIRARRRFCEIFKGPDKIDAVRDLIRDQIENPNFRRWWIAHEQSQRDQVVKIMNLYDHLEQLGDKKRDAVEEVYTLISPLEYDYFWQLASNAGIAKYLTEQIKPFDTLYNLTQYDPHWRMFCILAVREISPVELSVSERDYPFLTDYDLPLNTKDVLFNLNKLVEKISMKFEFKIPPKNLLEIIYDLTSGSSYSNLLQQLFNNDINAYMDFYNTELKPFLDSFDLPIFSGIHLANTMRGAF